MHLKVLIHTSLILAIVFQSAAAQAKPTKVLFVGKELDHPFGTHMYMHTCSMLAQCLELNGEIESVVSNGWPKDEKVLDGISTIVVYTTPAAEFLLDAPHRDQVTELLDQGVGLVTLHWASSIFEKNLPRLGPKWMDYLGGTWVSNVGLHTGESHLAQLVADHPICRGWQEYEIHDEYYLNTNHC